MASPDPFSASHAVIRALASATPSPSRDTSSFAELIAGPSPGYAVDASWSGGGCTMRTIGSSKALAKAKSRWSCAGTAMIAPVP